MYHQKKWRDSELEQKVQTPASRDNDIKTEVFAVPGRGFCHSM